MLDINTAWLLLGGVPIGIFGVVFGGNMFLSLPLFQMLFPEMSLGAIIGNIKPGSIIRNLAGLIPLRKHIAFKSTLLLAFTLCIGSVAGASTVANLSQVYIVPILMLGWLVMFFSSALGKYMTESGFVLGTLCIGVYGGIFGAGISLLIVSLMRMTQHTNEDLTPVRATALYLETVLTIVSVGIFMQKGLIDLEIALIWSAGSLVGGYLGGIILKQTGKSNPGVQRKILHIAFGIAILVALTKTL